MTAALNSTTVVVNSDMDDREVAEEAVCNMKTGPGMKCMKRQAVDHIDTAEVADMAAAVNHRSTICSDRTWWAPMEEECSGE